MILKQKDSLSDQILALEEAMAVAQSPQDRQRFEKQRNIMRAGVKGEEDAAYHVDFHLKSNPNWAVIHDLRLEWNGRVAQIDHLLIDRALEIYVVESKSFRTKIRRANGGWERINNGHWEGIQCPVEQNKRHIAVLEELIREAKLAPTRLGIRLNPRFFNVVLVGPTCSIVGEEKGIYRMDQFVTQIRNDDPAIVDILKVVSAETVQSLGADLVAHHRPAPTARIEPYGRQVAPVPTPKAEAKTEKSSAQCEACGGPLTSAEAFFCRMNKARVSGKLLCRKCQTAPVEQPAVANPVVVVSPSPTANPQEKPAALCASCGTGVDRKVVAFCRFQSKRFNGRILCRGCQNP